MILSWERTAVKPAARCPLRMRGPGFGTGRHSRPSRCRMCTALSQNRAAPSSGLSQQEWQIAGTQRVAGSFCRSHSVTSLFPAQTAIRYVPAIASHSSDWIGQTSNDVPRAAGPRVLGASLVCAPSPGEAASARCQVHVWPVAVAPGVAPTPEAAVALSARGEEAEAGEDGRAAEALAPFEPPAGQAARPRHAGRLRGGGQ